MNILYKVTSHIKKFFENPVFEKEVMLEFGKRKAMFVFLFYLLILAGVMPFGLSRVYTSTSPPSTAGRSFFYTICIAQWIMIMFIVPSFTVNAIYSERERKTLDILLLTHLRVRDIVIGKLLYGITFAFLLIFSSLPLASVVFLIGGISPLELVKHYAILFLWSILAACIGIFFSAREKKSAMAVSRTYGLIVAITLTFFPMYIDYVVNAYHYSLNYSKKITLLTIFIIFLWAISFLFYKSINYIKTKAKNILALHRGFILSFFLVFAGISLHSISTYPITTGLIDTYKNLWIILLISALMFMGCFLERKQFISKKEEALMKSSLTDNPFFFPLYFISLGVILFVLGIFLSSNLLLIKGMYSLGLYVFLIFFFLLTSRKLKYILGRKYKAPIIYYSILIILNIIPLVTYGISKISAIIHPSKGSSILSLVFAQPVLSMLSIWNPQKLYSNVDFFGFLIPTPILTFGWFLLIYITIYIISLIKKQKTTMETSS